MKSLESSILLSVHTGVTILILMAIFCLFPGSVNAGVDANGQLTAAAPSDLFSMSYINIGSGDALYTKYNDEWTLAQQEFLDNTQGAFPQSISGITPWNGQVGTVPTPVSDGTRLWYNIATPGELQAVFNLPAATLNNKGIRLTADLDFNGYRFTALANATSANNFAATSIQFDGQGYTLYNFYSDTGFIRATGNSTTIKNLKFKNVVLASTAANAGIGTRPLSLFGSHDAANLRNQVLSNIRIDNAMTVNNTYASILTFGGYQIDRCFLTNAYVLAKNHGTTVSLQTSTTGQTISNTGVVNGYVITGGHSGGFASCYGNANAISATFSNCFANIKVYCSADKAGTFFGYKTAGNLTFTDCFTTGRCEGTQDVGGFYAGADGSGTVNFTRCYTTAQVGVLTAGANLGGFIGNTANSTYRFADCYAAGEVGSLKTLPSQTGTQGGFSGDYKSGLVFTNCYYDKQTSAMREKGFGGNSYTQSTQPTTTLVGILTTGADGQTGLTEAPGTAGFKGFSSNNSGWRYRSGSYPQLTAFSDGDSALWGEDANLVQANSLASVTTIYLDTWNSGYNNRTLPTTVYDTVRDITVRFPMATMDNLTWALGVYTRLSDGSLGYRPAQTIIGSGAGAAFKRTLSVVTLGQLGGKNYVVDSAPGVEWVNALVTQGDQTARREIRLVPTCTLSPGADVVQSIGSTYDHRGVPSITTPVLTYSTAPILDTNGAMDPNTGEFDPAKAVYTFDNTYNKATNSSTRLNYADGASPLTSHRIHALLAKLAPDTLTAGTVITSSTLQGWIQNPVDNGSYLALDKKWTAQTPFVKGEDGYYYMDYVWELSDGRFIRNGKIISLKDNTHQVSITVVNTDGTPNAEAALIGASATGSSLSSTPFSNTQATFNDGTPVYLSYRLVPGSDGLPRYAVTNLSLSSGSTTTGWTTASPVESPDGTHYQLTKAAYDLFKSPDGSGYVVEKGSILRDYLLATLSGGTKVLTLNCNATQPLDNGEVLSYKDLAEDAKLQITVARVYNTFFIDPIRATPQNPYVSINSGILSGNSVGAAPAQNPGATVNAQGNYLEFKEWNTKADGTGTPYAPEQTIQNSDAKYYAVYRPLAMSLQKRLDGSTTEGGTRLSTDIGKPVGVSLALTMERPSAGLTALDITDTADAGLSLLPNTLDIYSGTNAQGTRLTQGVDYTQSLDKGTLTIHFSSDFLAQTTPWNPNFYIHYTMVPTADALLGQQGNQNTAALNYHAGDGLTSTIKAPPCVLYTYGLTIEKLGEGAALLSSTQLAGVRFTLTRADGTVLEFKPIVSGAYTGSMIPQTGGSPVLETNAQGKITLRGIGPGTYYLTETQTLPGYQLLKRPVLLVITTVDGSTGKVQATVDGRTASLANDGSSTSAILPMTIKNYPGFALPASGSFSLLGAIIAGSVLLGASALFTLRYWRH